MMMRNPEDGDEIGGVIGEEGSGTEIVTGSDDQENTGEGVGQKRTHVVNVRLVTRHLKTLVYYNFKVFYRD